jgi:hypothetical protein
MLLPSLHALSIADEKNGITMNDKDHKHLQIELRMHSSNDGHYVASLSLF